MTPSTKIKKAALMFRKSIQKRFSDFPELMDDIKQYHRAQWSGMYCLCKELGVKVPFDI
jgi:hypothetical protein